VAETADETRAIGARLGSAARSGDIFLLEGAFGTGKTVLVQGIAAGLGVSTPVTSPSFVIITQHQGRLPLHHVDLYRAEQLDPELEATVLDAVDAGGVTCIEWPQLLPDAVQREGSLIRLAAAADGARLVVLETDERRLADAADGRTPPAAGEGAGP
jgi:tRNA threonylcarbamoyladenosine biosynthesis protein TsaE